MKTPIVLYKLKENRIIKVVRVQEATGVWPSVKANQNQRV